MRAVKKQSGWRLGAIGLSAVSGIEVALWDILGKHLGVPVWRLLGGKVRDRVRVYTHLGLGDMRAVSETTDTAPLVTGVQSGGARLQASSELSSAVKRTSPAPRVLTGRHRLDQHET